MGTLPQSQRSLSIGQSPVRVMMEKATRMEREGRKIYHMEIGRPDFDTPEHIKAAAKRSLDEGQVHYTSSFGLPELRQAIAEKLARENGLKVNPANEILVTVGAVESVFLAAAALLNPGDEILHPDPCWPFYRTASVLMGATPVAVPLREENRFQMDPADVAARITPRTRVLFFASPQNPTGAVLPRATIEALAELARQHNLVVVSDEIYERIIYGVEHVSIASLPGMAERTVTINGFSKIFSMTGWRLGYAAAPASLIADMEKIHEATTSCANTFAQYGAVAALRGPQAPCEAMASEFRKRRELLVSGLNSIPGITCTVPDGAFYAFPNIKRYGLSSMEMAAHLIERAGVAVVPGSGLGPSGEGHLRLCFAVSAEEITGAVEAMRAALAELPLA